MPVRLKWYRVPGRRSGTLREANVPRVEDLVAFVRRILTDVGCTRLTIRDPEVWDDIDRWPPDRYFDGREIDLDDAIELVHAMLEEAGYWCRLESDEAAVHVGEDVVYLGLPDSSVSADFGGGRDSLQMDELENSPYAIVRHDVHPYRPADARFWDETRKRLSGDSAGLLLLRQWAGKLMGEQWFMFTNPLDIDALVDSHIPRSTYAVFPATLLRRRGTSLPAKAVSAVGMVKTFGNVRIFMRIAGEIRLRAMMVSDHDDLANVWGGASPDTLFFEWPDGGVECAVDPDSDGVIRVTSTFD